MAELQVGIKADVTGAKRLIRSLKEIKRAAGLTSSAMQQTTAAATGTSVALKTTVSASGQLAATQNLAAVANVAVAKTLGAVATKATQTAAAEATATTATNRLTLAFERMSLAGTKAFFKVGAGAKRFTTQARTAAGSLAGMSIAAQGLGALLAVGIGVGIKSALTLEKTFSRIEGLVGIAAAEVEAFKKPLLEIGKATGKGPNELAEALFFITSAGFEGKEAMDVLEASARAAAAGLGETKAVADAVTSAVNAYGIENLNAAKATDILVATVREGKAEADSIAGALGQILPTASELGIEFEELGGTIAALTRIGLGADQASTALGATMSAIQKPGADAKAALEEFGLTASGLRKTIREEGLLVGLQQMKEAFGDNEEALTRVVPNIRALRAVLPLVGRNAGDVAKIFAEVADSAGAANDAFDVYAKTTSFELDQAMVVLQTTLIKLGNDILPTAATAFVAFASAVETTIDATANAGEFWAEFFGGSDDPARQAKERLEELNGAIADYEDRINFVTQGAITVFERSVGGITLTGTYDQNLAALIKQRDLYDEIVARNEAERIAALAVNNALEDQVDIVEDIADVIDSTPKVIIDEKLLDKGRNNLAGLRSEVEFLEMDLITLQTIGKEGIGLAEDFFETKEIVGQLQGKVTDAAAVVRQLVNDKRALADSIEAVNEEFAKQDAAVQTIDDLVASTAKLAEQFAIVSTGGNLADITALQQARQIVADLGDDTEYTVDQVHQLILQEQGLNDVLKSLDVSRVDQLQSSLANILMLQGAATDESAIAQLGMQAKTLEEAIIAAELAAAGLDPEIILGAIPDEKRIEDALAPFKRLVEQGIITPDQLALIGVGIEEKVKGSFDAMEEFAIQAARNIQTALADFLYDPFSDGLDGMLVSFGETLRKMTSQLLANALLKQFLDSLGGASGGGIVGAVAGALGQRAEGGPVSAGKDFLVGEEGPEIFTPRQSGNIIPNGAMGGQQAAPVVEIGGPTIVNTIDDGMIVAAFNRGGGSDVVLNNMTENKAAFRNALGID